MLLYTKTGEKKYLEPIPRAIEYLRSSQLSEGKLARFYELQTNRPLYFTKDYKLTYDGGDVPTHYSFVVDSRLNQIEARYRDLLAADPEKLRADRSGNSYTDNAGLTEKPQRANSLTPTLIAQARKVIDGMDERGAWVERSSLRALGAASGFALGRNQKVRLTKILHKVLFINMLRTAKTKIEHKKQRFER